jgi:hypothetical protein
MTLEQTLLIVGALFSGATLCATFINARTAQRSASAAARQAEATIQNISLQLEETKRRLREFDESRVRNLMLLAQKIRTLWVHSCAIDNDVFRLPDDKVKSDLSIIPDVAQFQKMYLEFMENHGCEVAAIVGIDTIDWAGLRYLEDMLRYSGKTVPAKFVGQDNFYAEYKSVNQHLTLVKNSIIRKANAA